MKKIHFTHFVKGTGFQYDYNSRGHNKKSPKDYIPVAWLFGKCLVKKLKNRLAGRVELDGAEIYITTRCSLQCRDCAVLIPDLKDQRHFSRESLIEDLEKFFQVVNYVHLFSLVGGEPFLHPELPELIHYLIGQSRVGSIRIPTNGTILPGPELMKAIKSTPNICISISDYPLDIGKKKEELINLLDQNKIRYEVYTDQTWSNLGAFERVHSHQTQSPLTQLAQRVSECWMANCHSLLQGRFYLCGRSAFAPMADIHDSFPEDYVDLYGDNVKQTKRAILNLMGRPYLQACAFCGGTGAKQIPPAVQKTVA